MWQQSMGGRCLPGSCVQPLRYCHSYVHLVDRGKTKMAAHGCCKVSGSSQHTHNAPVRAPPAHRLCQPSSCFSGTVILEVYFRGRPCWSSGMGLTAIFHALCLVQTYPPHRNWNLLSPYTPCPPTAAPHLHAVAQDKLIDDEGDEVAAAHLP